jgi:hypothetical protein
LVNSYPHRLVERQSNEQGASGAWKKATDHPDHQFPASNELNHRSNVDVGRFFHEISLGS